MKKILLFLIGLTLAISMLVSCAPTSAKVQTPEPSDDASPVSALPEPSPSVLETPEPTISAIVSPSPEPTVSADVSPSPKPSSPTLLTFDEAREICATWLENHTDVPSEYFDEWVVDPYEIPPPTYYLFNVPYYKIFVSNCLDGASKFSHDILVQAETGALLSLSEVWLDENLQTTTVELLDDWYAAETAASAPASLTADEAIAVYDAWLQEHSDNPNDTAEYSLDKQSNSKFVLFGEQYYYFKAEDGWMYWYNILVHMETGELLFMMIEDGMFGGTTIMPLDDWYDMANVQ